MISKKHLTNIGIQVEKAIEYLDNHRNDIIIDNYCIMPNHVHLVIFVDNANERGTPVNGSSRMPTPTKFRLSGLYHQYSKGAVQPFLRFYSAFALAIM